MGKSGPFPSKSITAIAVTLPSIVPRADQFAPSYLATQPVVSEAMPENHPPITKYGNCDPGPSKSITVIAWTVGGLPP